MGRYILQNPEGSVLTDNKTGEARSQNRYARKQKQTAAETLTEKLKKSEDATELNTTTGRLLMETRSFADGKRLFASIWDAGSAATIRNALAFFTTEGITRLSKDKIKNIPKINKAVNDMARWRLGFVQEFAKDIPAWEKFNHTSIDGGRKLADTMHAATLKSVDPTLYPDAQTAIINDPQIAKIVHAGQLTRRANEIKEVYKLWGELGKYQNGKGQEIFKLVKQRYADNFDLHMQILQDTISNSALPGDGKDGATPKGQLLAQITQSFQEAKKLGVYFPLMRYGKYWLRVGEGKSSEFYMFESATARNVALRKKAEENPNKTREQQIADGELDTGDSLDMMQKQMGQESAVLKGIFELLDKNGVQDVQAIKDQVYQMYLMTLPEADIRKRFTKRQGRTGFSADALRNYITANNTSASQLARLRYAPDIRMAIASAYSELAGNPEKDKLKIFVDEMSKRASSEISGNNPNSVIASINQGVFLWMLTSIKSALVQGTQLPIVGFPVLAAKYGLTDATAISARYSYVFNKLSTTRVDDQGNVITNFAAPSFKDSPYIRNQKDPVYRAALKRAWEFGESNDLFMSTYAGDMSARSRAPSAEFRDPVSKGGRAVMNMMTGAFHHMERMSRENMFMGSFELEYARAKKSGMSEAAAQSRAEKEALKTTYEALFNYTRYNKPRAFKTPVGSLAFQFMTYPMQMTSFLGRNFFETIRLSSNKQDRKEAAIKFFGTMGMTFMFAGATGLPLYSVGMGFLEGLRELWRPDKDDPDADEYYDDDDGDNPLGKRNMDLWFRESFLPNYFGDGLLKRAVEVGPISALTDLNIGASTSLDGLWFRDDNTAETTKEAFQNFMFTHAFGPAGGLGSQWASGFDDLQNGDWQKGVEKFAPAFLRGGLTAKRLGTEGVVVGKDRAQMKGPEFFTFGKLLAQSVGFSSTTIADMQKAAVLTNRVTKDIEAEKSKVLDRLYTAAEKLDRNPTDANDAALDKAMDAVDEYNYKNGVLVPITGDTIKSSLKGKFTRRDSSVNGVYLNKRLSPFLQDEQSDEEE